MALAHVARALDGVRTPVLRLAFAHSATLRRAAGSRPHRLALIAVTSTALAFALALGAPGLLYLWGPLLLGVPHLVADVRYLVVRPPGALRYRRRDLAVVALLAATLWQPSPADAARGRRARVAPPRRGHGGGRRAVRAGVAR
jgi:hypothetical protein